MPIRARDVMTRKLVTIEPEATVRDLIAVLTRKRISGLPVVDGSGRPVGVVSRTDVLVALDSGFPGEDERTKPGEMRARIEDVLGQPVRALMRERIVAVDEEDLLPSVAQKMLGERIHRVLVTAGGKLVGIVSTFDLASALATMLTGLEDDEDD